MRYTYTLSILVTLWVVHCAGEHDDYVNQFVAYVDGAEKEVEGVKEFLQSNSIHIINTIKSDKHGYILHFQPNNSRIRSRSKRSSEGHSSITDLSSHPNIKSIRQEREIIREKRDYKSRQELAEAKRVVQKYLEELKLRSSQGQDRKEKILYDRQSELNYKRYYDNKDVFRRYQVEESSPPYDSSVYAILKDREYDPKESRYINLNDEHWKDQWYLDNTGQAGGPKFLDINVVPAWQQGYSGLNVSVCVLDDGIEHTHDDLRDNYWAEISTDFNSKVDDDPMPNPNQLDRNSHGTRCAGEIAAVANNSICGVGVAFNAKIGGVRILDGPVTDTLEADALLFQNQLIDIYSASWGPRDDGKTMEGPGKHCAAALEQGVREGRGGKGSIFVWATGNGGFNGDDCAADGYVSSPYTLSVGSINNYAESTYFMEWCPSTLAVIYTGGYHKRGDAVSNNEFTHPILKIVTTDVRNKCTLNFQGTSSAAPLAAGVMALALEANPSLTWRDLQHIVVVTSKVPNSVEKGWTINGAGLHINDKFGYGAIDAAQMVQVAQTWNNVGPQHTCTVKSTPGDVVMFNAKKPLTLTLDTDGCQKSSLLDDTSRVDKLEHVQMHVYLDTPRRGDIRLTLTSPAGTSSEMLSPRRNDDSKDGIDFTFMTVRCWNERPTGKWSLTVTDTADDSKNSLFYSWSLTLLGTAHSASTRDTQSLTSNRAFIPSQDILDKLINMEADAAVNVKIKLGSEVDVIKDFSSDSQITNDSGVTPTSPSDLALHLITSADRETSAADSLEASVSNILKGLSKHQVEQLIENFKRKVEIAKKERNIRRDQELYKLIEEYLDIS